MDKSILLASFILLEKQEWFLNYLKVKFNIPKDKVFGYHNVNDETKIILTFKLLLTDGKQINLKSLFPNAITIHKRGDALYTINALNALIDLEYPESRGNIDYKSIKIDWTKYQNKFILVDDKELVVLDIHRIF